jgi:hypothetical protein
MGYTTLSLGLTLTIPTNATRNWGTTLLNTTWTKISQHRHQGSGDGQQIPTAGIVDLAVTSAKLASESVTVTKLGKNLGLYRHPTLLAPSGTTQTVDWNNGNLQKLSLASATGDVTLTLSDPVAGGLYVLFVLQGAAPRDLIWPAGVKWPQAQKPILSTANGAVDMVILIYDGTDAVYRGMWDLDLS